MKKSIFVAAVVMVCVAVPMAWQQWRLQVTGVSASLRGVSAPSASVVWASGSGSTILRSETGGDGWARIPPPSKDKLDFRDIDAITDSMVYLLSIGSGAQSRIYKTTDAGKTWTLQFTNDNPKAFFDAMSFWDADRGLAISDSVAGQFVIISTEDGGKTWARIPPDRLPAALPGEGAFAASGTNIALWGPDHVWIGTGASTKARVLRSADRGKTWQIAETPLAASANQGIYSIAFRDAQHGVVVGGDHSKEREAVDNAAITADGGATWTLVKGLGGLRSLVAYVPGTEASFLAVGPSGADLTRDGGKTWTPIEGPGFHTFTFVPGQPMGWAAGSGGRVATLTITK